MQRKWKKAVAALTVAALGMINICRLWWKYSFRWKSGSGHIGSRRTGND